MGLKAVHFGGGNIGRGFVAEKLCISGFEVSNASMGGQGSLLILFWKGRLRRCRRHAD